MADQAKKHSLIAGADLKEARGASAPIHLVHQWKYRRVKEKKRWIKKEK